MKTIESHWYLVEKGIYCAINAACGKICYYIFMGFAIFFALNSCLLRKMRSCNPEELSKVSNLFSFIFTMIEIKLLQSNLTMEEIQAKKAK